jgi:hypothetical protein
MRSRMTWVAVTAAAVSAAIACSDDAAGPLSMNLPSQPGTGGSSGATTMTGPMQPAPTAMVGMGGSNGEGNATPPLAGGQNGAAAGTRADAGAAAPDESPNDAGAPSAVPDAAPAPDDDDDPPAAAVDFTQVFPVLVARCGGCHGANAPGNRPRFAQTGNEAASSMATQAISPIGGPVSGRILLRAVTARNMPPACNGAALGSNGCISVAEGALLQAWVDQGAQP